MTYEEQIKSKEWISKRNEILLRDKNECQMCMSKSRLHVHHKRYVTGMLAWEYENNYLITVCEKCHSNHHRRKYKGESKINIEKNVYKSKSIGGMEKQQSERRYAPHKKRKSKIPNLK